MICSAQAVTKAKLATTFAPRGRAICRTTAVQVQAHKITFITPDGTSEVECEPTTYILDAAEENGVDLPYSCRAGACSSCAGVVESGTVDHGNQTFLSEAQINKGFVLTCYAYPTSDCTIRTHQEQELY